MTCFVGLDVSPRDPARSHASVCIAAPGDRPKPRRDRIAAPQQMEHCNPLLKGDLYLGANQ
jgi:hypothetical protein